MIKILKNNQGFALILTILVISVIVVLSLQFNLSMRSDLYSATNLRDGISLASIARSGFNSALAFLTEDASKTDFDSLHESWAYAKAFSSYSAAMFEQGQFALEITDLSGKIPINQLVDKGGKENKKQRDLLNRFLSSEPFELDPENVDNILDAIKDWIDPDDEVTRFGAENGYYQGLERPYKCKNGPFEFLEQLLLVRGITNELFYGSEKTPGLSQYLTVHSEGKININTADPMVLKSLSPEMDWAAVENMVEYRLDKDNDLKNITWYKRAHGLDHINIDSDLVTTTSTHFEIISQGFKGEMEKILTAVVKRDKGTVKILSWKIE